MPSVPSLDCIRAQTRTHTNLVLLCEIALGLLGLYHISLQLVEPHFELPQALSLLSLGGQNGGGVVGLNHGWKDEHGNGEVQRGDEEQMKEKTKGRDRNMEREK